MRRLEPQASLALPPISPRETAYEVGGPLGGSWTITTHKGAGGGRGKASASTSRGRKKQPLVSASARLDSVVAVAEAAKAEARASAMTARGVAGERGLITEDGAVVASPHSPSGGENGPEKSATKGRAIETWLNVALGQADVHPSGAPSGGAALAIPSAAQKQGLTHFGVDAAALEKLGLDAKSSERVYRAMFVYSQGLHAVLQEAVGRSKNASQALLVLWRAFTAVLEHAGQSEQDGAESLAALVQRGNEEEKARIEAEYREQIVALQGQSQKVADERRNLQLQIGHLREDELRLRNENEMYRNEHQVAMSKYEREIKARVDAEVRFLEKTRWAEALQEDLTKERKQSMHFSQMLSEASAAREAAVVELDLLRTQVKMQEAQVTTFKQAALEVAQQKQRHEQQVIQYKANLERAQQHIAELKEQLESEAENGKRLAETSAAQTRENRKLETKLEDETHFRKELQNERDVLRERLEKTDADMAQLLEERRLMQREINDLSMKYRTDQIELKRLTDSLARAEKALATLEVQHRELLDAHRSLKIEADYLREDVKHLDEQHRKESELRKALQHEKKQLQGQLQTVQIERDTAQLAVAATQKELQEVTEKMVKLESIVRETKSAMSKVQLEHQLELKAHSQKVAMLEKVIADERNERRNLVKETMEVSGQREESLEHLKKKDLDIAELKRQRLEREEEVDRYKVLLKAQEQRNSEQLVTVDKYHAAVANHDAEMRQMQVLLKCEREEAKRQLEELQHAYAAARHTMEQRADGWKMRFEDAFSRLNFNPATAKIHRLQDENIVLQEELKASKAELEVEQARNEEQQRVLEERENTIKDLEACIAELREAYAQLEEAKANLMRDFDRQSLGRADAEQRTEHLQNKMASFDRDKAELEGRVAEARRECQRLAALLDIPKADASTQAEVRTAVCSQQTDLSYQYLEASDRLQSDPRRRERLDALKKASNFVDEANEGRDFTVQMRALVPGQGKDLRLEPAAAAAGGGSRLVHMGTNPTPAAPPASAGTLAAAVAGGRGGQRHAPRAPRVGEPQAPPAQRPGRPPEGNRPPSLAITQRAVECNPLTPTHR